MRWSERIRLADRDMTTHALKEGQSELRILYFRMKNNIVRRRLILGFQKIEDFYGSETEED